MKMENGAGHSCETTYSPAKTLTDEELTQLYVDFEENYTGTNFPVDLGRAILKKASEK